MNADAAKNAGVLSQTLRTYEELSGESVRTWAVLAIINLVFQLILFRELFNASPGEYGLFNVALGIIGLLVVPFASIRLAFRLFPSLPQTGEIEKRLDFTPESKVAVMNTLAWIWGGLSIALILLPLPPPNLPRFPLQLLVLLNVVIALAGIVSQTICEGENQLRHWLRLVVAAAVIRVLIGGFLTSYEPWADSGLAAVLVVGFITLTPALRPRALDFERRLEACLNVLNRDFLLFVGATISVSTGIYLFTNADRIVSVQWVDEIQKSNILMGVDVKRVDFDSYQAMGLLARSLLWATQPLIWIAFSHRTRLKKTSLASLKFAWIYLGALILGAIGLGLFTQRGILDALNGPFSSLGNTGPTFAAVMIPLGILQGIGIFSLASRRYPECFVLGGCGVAYTLVLAFFGRRPELILPYMFGSAVVCIMIILFVGVVRWGRKQP